MSDKSLQINLNTLDDAKSLVQNLSFVKKSYDAHHCTSILLVINEAAVVDIEDKVKGLVNWTRVYRHVERPQVQEGSVRIFLPHYKEVAASRAPHNPDINHSLTAKRPMRRKVGWQPPGKTQPLVQAEMAGT